VYPSITPMVPANIALIKGGPNLEGAKRFINFTLSQEGQKLLFSPQVSRLPVVPNLYDQAPAGFPNPFKMSSPIRFDVNLSQQRYDVINALFDWFVTFRLKELKQAWKEIYKAEVRLAKKRNQGQEMKQLQNQLLQAKSLVTQLPVEEILVNSLDFNQNWSEVSSQYEQQWDQLAKANYNQARKIARSIK
ncbi:MAG: ABC transporter substrate-binding protein, partial [Candidatus Poribacteria bacterium]|nr:ABC transporter substrate-binding protein [Candidatus Poribacteria bacterium]